MREELEEAEKVKEEKNGKKGEDEKKIKTRRRNK